MRLTFVASLLRLTSGTHADSLGRVDDEAVIAENIGLSVPRPDGWLHC